MTNSTESNMSEIIIAYYSLILIFLGTFMNLLTFFILFRSKFRNIKERPTIFYMRIFVIIDILMLYGWNFDHYTKPIHNFDLSIYSIVSCKFSWFLNYFCAQTSAWIRVLILFDRYISLTYLHRTWFSHSRNALILILCIICFFILFNIHFLIFACYYETNGKINRNSKLYQIIPIWDWINLIMYNCLPFLLMIILNSGIIYHLIRIHRQTSLQHSRIHHRTVSITSVITTFLFMIMTIPATIGFGFLINSVDYIVLLGLDAMLYTYHILSFPLFLITFDDFRREFLKIICWKRNHRRISPHCIRPS